MFTETRNIPGSGTVVSAGGYEDAWTHGLGTATPQLALFELVEPSPEKWRFVPSNEFTALCTTAGITLVRASTPPTPGHVGALKLIAVRLDAAPPSASPVPPGGGLISSAQLSNLRARASSILAATFPTVIAIGDRTDIPAARWSLARSAEHELAGLLPSPDVAIRVERAAIEGLTITEGRTKLIEDGREMRVQRIRDAKGDPGLVLECKAV